MKKVAYLITRNGTRELIEGCLLNTVSKGKHGAKVLALHFAEDGVYHLIKGTTTGKKIEKAIKEQGVKVLACECSVENRGIKDKLIDDVPMGHFSDFYALSEEADHVIAI